MDAFQVESIAAANVRVPDCYDFLRVYATARASSHTVGLPGDTWLSLESSDDVGAVLVDAVSVARHCPAHEVGSRHAGH